MSPDPVLQPPDRPVVFTARRRVRFSDCDPAGIVFFPQYLVMLNGLVEQWFDDGLRIPYAGLLGARRTGLPTVRLEVDFTAISRHGDDLVLSVEVEKLGGSSLVLAFAFHAAGDGDRAPELRLRGRQVLVCTSLQTHRPLPLPDDVRQAIAEAIANANLNDNPDKSGIADGREPPA